MYALLQDNTWTIMLVHEDFFGLAEMGKSLLGAQG
jgi:hypothetical protein